MAYTYCTATNTGKGFYTVFDRNSFHLEGHPGDVWIVDNNNHGISWINRINGTAKVKAEAQAIVDAKVQEAIDAWDNLPADKKAPAVGYIDIRRPEKYTLP